MSRQKRAYISGPYRSETREGIAKNIAIAKDLAIVLWQMGLSPFCPHLNTAHFDGLAPDEVWLSGDLEWVDVSELLVTFNGWEKVWQQSIGTVSEVNRAIRIPIPVFHYPQADSALRAFATS